MGFQINGVEWINSSGHFTQGLKTAQNTAMTGTGSMTTNTAAVGTFGTTRNSVGSIAFGIAIDGLSTYTATPANSFQPLFLGTNSQSGYSGLAPTTTGPGSSIRDYILIANFGAYPLNESNWRISSGWFGTGQLSGSNYVSNFSGSWTPIANYMDRGTYFPSSIYMRVS